jgi:putative radical SAM enzyme (TIGR03279 family)
VKIVRIEPESVAMEAGILEGDELLEINEQRIQDAIDLRFYEPDAAVVLKIARNGEIILFDIEKDDGEPLGIDLEEMTTLACGNDCIFCFVDQNPGGLRKPLYFRDGDYRLSFMYGNYTTMTNAGPAILRRIITQRLSPQYISVHTTVYEVRKRLMGLKKDDHILEKIALLHDNGIDMHTQIVLCPGINDGESLRQTVSDLYRFRERIVSLAVVPVGLTDHRFGLSELRRVDAAYAREVLDRVDRWQEQFRSEIGRGFIYASDEFYLLAGRPLPVPEQYDDFPQIENGVGMVRSFLLEFEAQAKRFPGKLPRKKSLTLVTAELPSGVIAESVLPRLRQVRGLDVRLVVAPNTLYGRSVTVAGLLSANCVYFSLNGVPKADLVLLPPDILNADGVFLDDESVPGLSERLGSPVMVFDGSWPDVFRALGIVKTTDKRIRRGVTT